MKLIVSGATGFVGSEVIKQSLSRPEITSVVALARKPVSAPSDGADPSKLKSVVVKDYDDYPDEVKREFAGASACIWTVAITPTKSKMYDFEEVRRVCQASPLAALKAMHDAGPARPFRFLYMSGASAERDQTKAPRFYAQYSLMRGETETQLLALASSLPGVEAASVRPGLVSAPGAAAAVRSVLAAVLGWAVGVPSIGVADLAAVMLDQAVAAAAAEGLEKDPLVPGDLARLAEGRKRSGSGGGPVGRVG